MIGINKIKHKDELILIIHLIEISTGFDLKKSSILFLGNSTDSNKKRQIPNPINGIIYTNPEYFIKSLNSPTPPNNTEKT